MHNKRTIHRWGWVLSWFALTRLRWLESVARIVSALAIYLMLFPLDVYQLFASIFLNIKRQTYRRERKIQSVDPLLEHFALLLNSWLGRGIARCVFALIRLGRIGVYALIASLMMLPIWASFGARKVSWISVIKLMAIDHVSREPGHRSVYTRFAVVVLTHQLEGNRLSDGERLYIDGELSKLQDSLYGSNFDAADETFIKDGPNSVLVHIEELYARLHESSAAPYRVSSVRIKRVFDDGEVELERLDSCENGKVRRAS